MLTRRETLQVAAAAALAAPVLTACGAHEADGGQADPGGPIKLDSADVARSAGDPGAVPGTVSSLGAFTSDLWGRIGGSGHNLALSPYSIAVALAMTANGAAGRTAHDMLDTLHVHSLASYNSGMCALSQELAALAGPVTVAGQKQQVALTPANQLFGDASVTWSAAYLTVLAKMYGAGMRTVDFVHDPEQARVLVNGWTSERTHHRIPQILPSGVVDTTTRLVLVNALYFKAPWATAFQTSLTASAPFHRAGAGTVSVPMMHTAGEGQQVYVSGQHFSGARLPYAGGGLAMTVALPGPDEEAALAELLADGLTADGEPGLALTMPRWSFRVATDLTTVLGGLGMEQAFTDAADFSRMTTQERLHLQFVLHQAFVAVDEQGTEAAAATAVGMTDSAGVLPSHELTLDRPFLFVLHDTAHGTPLFVGRVADPS